MGRFCQGKGRHRLPSPHGTPSPHLSSEIKGALLTYTPLPPPCCCPPSIPVFFAIWQQGWALSPRAFCANVGVSAGHHAGGEVVLQETRPGGE